MAVDKLLASWPAVKLYFINLGENECSPVVWQFVIDQTDELTDDVRSNELSIAECYLYFVRHFMFLMHTAVMYLEVRRTRRI